MVFSRVLPLSQFGTPSTNIFFALILKIFLKTFVELIFNKIKLVMGPPGTHLQKNENFTYEVSK